MDGVLVIDKPAGPTSHAVVALVKRLTRVDKIGHLGTLDPAASGVLPLVINGATRHAKRLAGDEKIYEFTLFLGVATDTDDESGNVISRKIPDGLHFDDLSRILERFTGRIMQRPPLYSAKKVYGRRACDLSRDGMQFNLLPRPVNVDAIEIIGGTWPEPRLRLKCRAGTYVRSLCRDLGEALGCGGHARAIRRLRSGAYIIDEAVPPEALKPGSDAWHAYLLPV